MTEDENIVRPRTRGECHPIRRELGDGRLVPCPFVTCRYNLHVDHVEYSDTLRMLREYDPDSTEPSCALDLADQGAVLEQDVADIFQLGRQRIDQIQRRTESKLSRNEALARLHKNMHGDAE